MMKPHRITLALSLVIAIPACQMLGPDLRLKLPDNQVIRSGPNSEQTAVTEFTQLKNTETAETLHKPEIQEYPGTGQFVTTKVKMKQGGGARPEGKYKLNFVDADLAEVVGVILGDSLGENYVINPKVAGRVTLETAKSLTREELLPTLEMLLRMNGAALVKDKGTYRIEPVSSALQVGDAPLLYGERGLPVGYQVRVVPLEYVGVTDMVEILKPLVPTESVVRADPARNLLLLAGTAEELDRIVETVKIFDVNVMEGLSFGLYPLDFVDVKDVMTELDKLFAKDTPNPLAGMFRFVPIERLNAIMVITHQPKYLEEVQKWVKRLDRASTISGEGEGIIVYRAQHVDAVKLAEILNQVISGTVSSSTSRKGTVAPGQQSAQISNRDQRTPETPPVNRPAMAARSGSGTNARGLEGVVIIPDENNNALVIMATAQQYKRIESIIKQLDVMPLQVLIDATIISVNLSDELRYGVQWRFDNALPNNYSGEGTWSTLANGALAAAFPGFSYSIINSTSNIKMVLNTLAKESELNVVSSPSLMVLNNQEATIQVGDQVPIETGRATNTSGGVGGAIVTNQIQMRDTGVTLKVKPRVNANGVVIMEISQSVDSVKDSTTPTLTPTILQRKINSSVAVSNGETVVLGGLISETNDFSNSGLPWLRDLPILGDLFAATGKTKRKEELIVLITPRVVQNKADAKLVAEEYKSKLSGIYHELPKQPSDAPTEIAPQSQLETQPAPVYPPVEATEIR